MEECTDTCGWCGAPGCDWERYGGELKGAGEILQLKLPRRRQQNRAVRLSLRRMYLYWKNGSMRGDIPACINR
ncbi:hypothetical protein DVH05_014786 [Phytophthora capsici]|nr:hypothetical protein DVH05_014786 [Phytophthora capsici]